MEGEFAIQNPLPRNLLKAAGSGTGAPDLASLDGNLSAASTNSTLPIDMRFNEGHVISITTYSILMVISAVGNITVLVILLRRRRKARSRINNMLMHLSIADLLVTFLMMPLEIGWNVTVVWLAGDALCRIMAFFRIFGLYLSSFVLVCISIDRYFAVLRPMQISDRRGRFMLTGAWIAATVCSMPQMVVFHVEAHPDFRWYLQCITFGTFSSKAHELIYLITSMVATYCLPLAVIIFSYASILLEIFKRSRDPMDERLRRSSLGHLGRAKIRTLKMTIIIVLVFFVCWTPYYVMCVWYWVDNTSAKEVDQRVQKGLFIFASANSCMNPIVYGAFNIRSRRSGGSQERQHTASRRGALGVLRLVSWRKDGTGTGTGTGTIPSAASSSEHATVVHTLTGRDGSESSQGSQVSIPLSTLTAVPEHRKTVKSILRCKSVEAAATPTAPRSHRSPNGTPAALAPAPAPSPSPAAPAASGVLCHSCGESLRAPVPDVTAVAVARERGELRTLR